MAGINLYNELNAVCQLDLDTQFQDRITLLKGALDPTAAGPYTTPLFCYKMDMLLKLFKDEFLPQIEKKATDYKLQHGLGLNKGYMEPPLEVTIGDIPLGQYLRMFFQRDPLPFNHNGTTLITTKDAGGGDDLNQHPNLSEFVQYFTAATTTMPQLRDALSYYRNDNKVYLKYKMPTVYFSDTAGTIVAEVSRAPNRFLDGGALNPTVVLGDLDRANLEQISLNSSTERVPGKHYGTNPVTYKHLNTRYTFPNFLLGEMLYKTHGKGLGKDFKVYRPYKGDLSPDNLEFWAMNYEDTEGEFFPYDKTKYVLPAGWRMIERADGVIMYISPQNIVHSDFPPGSYYILNGVNDDATRRTVFKKSARHEVIMGEVTRAIGLGLGTDSGGLTGAYNEAQMMLPIVQAKLQLLAYTTNLIMLEQMIGGDIKKKKTKRRNVIKHVAKSKKKHNHK